jgi:hypothetical protein
MGEREKVRADKGAPGVNAVTILEFEGSRNEVVTAWIGGVMVLVVDGCPIRAGSWGR